MGMCCAKGNTKRNEGVPIIIEDTLSADYSDKKPMSREDLRIVLSKIYILEYNMKLYDKRSLQAQRAKTLKTGLNEKYLELVKETRRLDDEISAAVKAQVFEDYKIPSESFEAAMASPDSHEISEVALMNLHKAIRDNRKKLGLSESAAIHLVRGYQNAYDKCNFMLNSSPAFAKELMDLYDENQSVNYIELTTGDSLFNDFNLLPIEILAFIEENESH
eukprot:TRINITY_DN9620_c0_g4_i1.p1 TRINITY_DN9620_c0_g4~~TRINITY_DN9620_c0_g4_i1.p1  ORF type:complete len:243 (-),score=56.06 TRINITY_DN9620_c0_g4_i1:73-729(-)